MDSGLKRLWTRRKTKGREIRHGAEAGSLRKSQSTDLVVLSTYERRGRYTPSGQVGHGLSPITTTSSSVEPVSGDKTQPMLLGMSRPVPSPSIPGTSESGSLMSAVNRAAADAGAKAEQEYHQSTDSSSRGQRQQKVPRYIDIFSLSKANDTNPMPGYNEDVAERNLDLSRVALEGTHRQLPPSSKYAEEVAARNAYPPLRAKKTVNAPFPSSQQHFDESAPSDLSRDLSSKVSDYLSGSAGQPDHSEWSRLQLLSALQDQHSRQSNETSWQPRSPTREWPTLVQASPGPLLAHHVHYAKDFNENLGDRTIAARSTGHPSRLDQIEALRSYQLSAAELMQASRPATSRPATALSMAAGTRRNEHPLRSHSSMSNTSVKRAINLPHRTIMDLTGTDSDIFSEEPSESAYSSAPVVGQEKFETMRPVYGNTLANPPFKSDRGDLRTSSSLPTEEHGRMPEALSQNQSPAPSVSEFTVRSTPTKVPTNSELSSISTSASSAAHTGILIQPKETTGVSGSNKAHTFAHELPVPYPPVEQATSGSRDLPTDSSHIAGTRHNTEPRKQTQQEIHDKAAEVDILRTAEDDTPQDAIDTKSDCPGAGFATQSLTEEVSPPQAHTQTLPGRVPPVDFVEPGKSWGVQSRDFADAFSKPGLTSVPEDTESSGSSRAQHTRTSRYRSASHDPNTGRATLNGADPVKFSLYHSTFNEHEFAQKQADARAALIRLQESLNENFLTHPSLAAQSSKPAASKHSFSYSDGKPVAPSTIFAQVRDSPPIPAKTRFSADMATEVDRFERPVPRSYHSLTTVPDFHESRRNGHAVGVDGRKKSKQSNNVTFDGPGPSIVDQEQDVKTPLPMPPPLHMNGRRLQQLDKKPVPPSPGEVSLSSFPLPVSSPRTTMSSETTRADSTDPVMSTTGQYRAHSQQSSDDSRVLRRPTSQRSQASSTSVFIPYHMIPDRSSSIRDRSVKEEY
ncbi:hypothetical protein PV08_08034 [Exophiala spinifera]|uniref:Uncharacterized protein n=1 Tax=Exophiala spinifera TaxID=91928 RepID=A0A0D1ZJ10_9EURO|nr:uncharacterized protein PV08_08034 [Exophiala spinifera]KIW12847.1 hypothetical protein PV08_08034 [Exophiala spinifera]